jgi:hypothetical protein
MYFKVQLVVSRNDNSPYLADGLYLVQADNPTVLDGVAKALVAKHLIATDYVHDALPDDFGPPAAITLGNPDSIALGTDLTYTDDLGKVDWESWRSTQGPSVD